VSRQEKGCKLRCGGERERIMGMMNEGGSTGLKGTRNCNEKGDYKMEHFDPLLLFLSRSGKTTDLMASSNTCLSPFCVSAEHSM